MALVAFAPPLGECESGHGRPSFRRVTRRALRHELDDASVMHDADDAERVN